MDGPLTSMVMLLANRATSEKLRPPIAIALGIAIALYIAILTVMCLLRRRDDNKQWGAPPVRPLTDHEKDQPIYRAGARQGEPHAKFVKRVKKFFRNAKSNPKRTAEVISKYNAKNNPKNNPKNSAKNNAKTARRLLVEKLKIEAQAQRDRDQEVEIKSLEAATAMAEEIVEEFWWFDEEFQEFWEFDDIPLYDYIIYVRIAQSPPSPPCPSSSLPLPPLLSRLSVFIIIMFQIAAHSQHRVLIEPFMSVCAKSGSLSRLDGEPLTPTYLKEECGFKTVQLVKFTRKLSTQMVEKALHQVLEKKFAGQDRILWKRNGGAFSPALLARALAI